MQRVLAMVCCRSGDAGLHRKALVHTAAVMKDWMAAKDFRLVEQLLRADFFLFPTIKRQLVGKVLTQETFKSIWEGATQTIAKEDFATAFQHWDER